MKKLFVMFLVLISFNTFSQKTDSITLKEIEIKAHKATNLTPIPYLNLKKDDLITNYGQEPSYIFNQTPSITSTADGGAWGYSYIRLRGIDQTRINFTLNGVPLNEPEDQGCYLSNYPDFLKSIDNVQIVRGSGLIKNGVSSFAGSINFESYLPSKRQGNLDFGIGTENSLKTAFSLESNIKNLKYYVQASNIITDGFKYHSGNKSKSLFLNTTYLHKNQIFKLIQFYGNQANELSWLGVSIDSIPKDRKANGCSSFENDNYQQYHVQFNHFIKNSSISNINYTLYYNHLNGYYTFDLNNFLLIPEVGDIYKYNVNSNFVGLNINHSLIINRFKLNTGINGYYYNRTHIGSERTIGFLYKNNGYRKEISAYINPSYRLDRFTFYGNVQYRNTSFDYIDELNTLNFNWDFINYIIGIDYEVKSMTFYYCVGQTNREATRNDILGGNDYLLVDSLGVPIYNEIVPENVLDQELGMRFSKNNLYFNTNLYYMKFKNEITLNGQFGPTGLPLHNNVDNSFRSGIELDAKYRTKYFDFNNNSSYSYSRILQQDLEIVPILTPELIVNQNIIYKIKKFYIGVNYRYCDGSYIDFSNKHWIGSYNLVGGLVGYKSNRLDVNLIINNIFNTTYFTSGALNVYGEPVYFIQQPINSFINVLIKI